MVTLFKRLGIPHYYSCFQHKGEDIFFSTRTGNRTVYEWAQIRYWLTTTEATNLKKLYKAYA